MKSNKLLFSIILASCLVLGFLKTFAQNRPTNNHRTFINTMFGHRDTTYRDGVFTIFPTNFVASTAKAGYEFKIAHNKGLKLMASFGSSTGSNDYYYLDKFSEAGLEAQFRIYVLKDHPALNGLYLAPYVSYKSMTYSGATNYDGLVLYVGPGPVYVNNVTASDFGIGYVIGYQWIFNSTFTVDVFAGGGNNSISGNTSGGNLASTVYEYRSGIDFHSGIGIGIAF
jgi:hypothetical protein